MTPEINLVQAFATPDWLETALRRRDLEIPVQTHEQFMAVAAVLKQGRVVCHRMNWDHRKNEDNTKFRFQIYYPVIKQADFSAIF